MAIGLTRGTVAVLPHDIEWEIAAQKIIDNLKSILKDDIVDAQHIGSTAVKSICAKPIIDIVVGVNSFDRMLAYEKYRIEKVLLENQCYNDKLCNNQEVDLCCGRSTIINLSVMIGRRARR